MSTTEIIQIAITTLGGIALLLYGMNVLGSGLEKNFRRKNGENSGKAYK